MRFEKGRIKYSYQPKNNKNDAILCLPPLPVSHYEKRKFKLHQWYKKNYQHVDDITDIILEAFRSFLETRPIYYVQLDEQLFREYMVYTLYNKSYNAYKDFP
jgi:hypothetical protein